MDRLCQRYISRTGIHQFGYRTHLADAQPSEEELGPILDYNGTAVALCQSTSQHAPAVLARVYVNLALAELLLLVDQCNIIPVLFYGSFKGV